MRTITPVGQSPDTWLPALHSTAAVTLNDLALTGEVLVVSAHADDETLGAGGLLCALADVGSTIRCIICTDGAAAFPDATDSQRKSLAIKRQAEARLALQCLGMQNCELTFLDIPDGRAQEHESEITEMILQLSKAASMILAPWSHDPHRDHRAAGRSAARVALEGKQQLLEYPV